MGNTKTLKIDTGSPVTIMPSNPELYNQKDIQPLIETYQDVNKNQNPGESMGRYRIQQRDHKNSIG